MLGKVFFVCIKANLLNCFNRRLLSTAIASLGMPTQKSGIEKGFFSSLSDSRLEVFDGIFFNLLTYGFSEEKRKRKKERERERGKVV